MNDEQLRSIMAAQQHKAKMKTSPSSRPKQNSNPNAKIVSKSSTNRSAQVSANASNDKPNNHVNTIHPRINSRSRYARNEGIAARYVKRLRKQYCYSNQFPSNEVSTTPLRNVFTYQDIKSTAGDLIKYTTLKKYHQRQHGSARITTRHSFHTTNPRLSTGFIEYFRQRLIHKYALNPEDARKLNTARVIYICMSSEANPDVQDIIADGFSTDSNRIMQKIQHERNNDAHSHTVRESLSTLNDKLDSVLSAQSHIYELQGHRFTRIRRMLYALGMFICDIFSVICVSGSRHLNIMNNNESTIGRLEDDLHRKLFKSGLVASLHNLHSNSEVATRRHRTK